MPTMHGPLFTNTLEYNIGGNAMNIRFGACVGTDTQKMAQLAAAGYDYAEISISAVAALDSEQLSIESGNGFFPAELKIVGEDVSFDAIAQYTQKALLRIKKLGARIAVLGSGKSRNIPDGYDRKTAQEQFVNVLRLCGDIAAQYGIIIVIEPLRTAECNFINTVADGLDICSRASHPNVKCLVDFYHAFMNGESMDAVISSGGLLKHAHIARSNADRLFPHCLEDMPACEQWAQALKACGYDSRLSLEGGCKDQFEDMIQKAKEYLKVFND